MSTIIDARVIPRSKKYSQLRRTVTLSAGNGGTIPTADTLPVTLDSTSPLLYGSFATPITSITYDLTNATIGGTAYIYYKDASDPFASLPVIAGYTFRKFGSSTFNANGIMLYKLTMNVTGEITVEEISSDTVPPVASNITLNDGANITVGVGQTVQYTYSQVDSVAQSTGNFRYQVWYDADQANLDEDDIESSTPTLEADIVGSTAYTPTAPTDGLYVRVRATVQTIDGVDSDWAYSPIYGPVATSFTPAALSSTVVWYDMTNSSGGTVGALANHWQFILNRVTGGSGKDYNQTATGNQADATNVDTNEYITADDNDRYQASSWSTVGTIIAAGVARTWYIVVKLPTGSVGDNRFCYVGGGSVFADTSANNYIKVHGGGLVTANNAIDPTKWLAIKIDYDGVDAHVEILKGNGVGASSATQAGGGALDNVINATAFQMDIYGSLAHSGAQWKHFILVDNTISASERTTLETWITDNTPT